MSTRNISRYVIYLRFKAFEEKTRS